MSTCSGCEDSALMKFQQDFKALQAWPGGVISASSGRTDKSAGSPVCRLNQLAPSAFAALRTSAAFTREIPP